MKSQMLPSSHRFGGISSAHSAGSMSLSMMVPATMTQFLGNRDRMNEPQLAIRKQSEKITVTWLSSRLLAGQYCNFPSRVVNMAESVVAQLS
jgi:hypothetical protein